MSKQLVFDSLLDQFVKFPGTRYMGSKHKIIYDLWKIISKYEFDSFFDAFSGSNVVGYFMKTKGKKVVTNDFMKMNYYLSKAIIENDKKCLSKSKVSFLTESKNNYNYIQETFSGIYFTDEENAFLDRVRGNIELLDNQYEKAIAISATVRSCLKKRPRGIFTYVGDRYNDGRNDVLKPLATHFKENIDIINQAVFKNGNKCESLNKDIFDVSKKCDLVYLDPPYYNPNGDNDYVRRYHFVEGLAKYWEGLEIQKHTITKKFKSYKSPFSVKSTTYKAFEELFKIYKDSIIVVSYSSNSLPSKEEMIGIMGKYKTSIKVHEISHTYSFGTQSHKVGNRNNRVKEYLFIAE